LIIHTGQKSVAYATYLILITVITSLCMYAIVPFGAFTPGVPAVADCPVQNLKSQEE